MANWLTGSEDTFKTLPTLNKQQQGIQSQAGGQINPLLQRLLGNQFDFGPIEQQARTGFETKTIPTLANRFQSMFGDSGARSSAFLPGLSSAGSEFEQGLAALKSQYGLQQQGQQQNLLNSLFGVSQQPGFENLFLPGKQGVLDFFGHGLGQGLGQLPALLLGGGAGGGLGMLSSLFGGGGQQQQQSGQGYQLGGGFGRRAPGFNPQAGYGQQNYGDIFGRGQSVY